MAISIVNGNNTPNRKCLQNRLPVPCATSYSATVVSNCSFHPALDQSPPQAPAVQVCAPLADCRCLAAAVLIPHSFISLAVR